MSLGLLFWLLFVLWIVLYLWAWWPADRAPQALGRYGGGLLLIVLIFLLGWGIFGFIVRGP